MADKKLETLAYRLSDISSLRDLFSELNFDFADNPVNKDNWNDDQKKIVQEARIIASKDDYKIYYIQTNTDSLKEWKAISAKIIKDNHGLCMICSHNPSGFKWVFSSLSKDFSKSFSETRHVPIDITPDVGVPKTFVDFLEKIKVGKDSTGISIVSQISEAFDSFAVQIHDELTVNVFEALKVLSEGIISDKSNNLTLDEQTLEEIREPVFILLYRIIFILYAEDRGIFPTEQKVYREKFSFKWLKENWLLHSENKKNLSEYDVQERLWGFFRLIELGSEDLGYDSKEFFMRAYYGRLFDRKINSKLDKWKIQNNFLLDAISLLTRTHDKKGNYFFLDYSALETRHLGSIYEHLLEFHLTVKNNKIADLPNPEDRKSSGSYYTPKYVVDYIVKETIEPLIEEILKNNSEKETQIEKILSLKILDPAMGSGHFLVGAVEYLATQLCEIEFGEVLEHHHIERKRDVVRRCIYGIDINPLSVDLARLSLWLETLSSDKPLSFLSAHLKTGNSLIGNDLQSIFDKQTTIFESEKGRNSFRKNLKKFLMFEGLEDDSTSAVKIKLEEYSKIQSKGTIYYDLKFLLNCKLGESFGISVPNLGDYRANIGENSLDFFVNENYNKIKQLSESVNFFHWELEFPQIFYDEKGNKLIGDGFDAIIGNPPYFNLQSVKDQNYKSVLLKKFPNIYSGEGDILYLFFGLYSNLLKKDGYVGFITSRYYLEAKFAQKLRHNIKENLELIHVIDFGSKVRIFPNASTNTCVTILRKTTPVGNNFVNIVKVKDWDDTNENLLDFIDKNKTKKIKLNDIHIHKSIQNDFSDLKWTLDNAEIKTLKQKLYKNSKFLGSFNGEKGICKIFQGFSSGLDFLKTNEGKKEVFRITENTLKQKKLEKQLMKPLIKIGMIRRYRINYTNEFTILTTNETKIDDFPNIKKHLNQFKKELGNRHDIKKGGFDWWRYANLRNFSLLLSKHDKLFVPMISPENRFVFIKSDEYVCGGDVYVILLEDDSFDLRYVQGILNSRLMNNFVKNNSKSLDGSASTDDGKKQRRYSYNSNNISNIPIKIIPKQQQLEVSNFVIQIEKLYSKTNSEKNNEKTKKEIKIIDQKINSLVNEIYQVSEEDIEQFES